MNDILRDNLYLADIKKTLTNVDCNRLKNTSFLITGGLGLICSSVVDLLIIYNKLYDANIHVFIADINENGFLARYAEYPFVKYISYDATKPIEFDIEVDYIIHGAGVASPELYVTKPVETILSNFNGVLNLLEYCREHQVQRMLYISSSEVYGNKDTEDAFCEDKFGSVDINVVRSSYSEAKRASEVLCKSYASEYDVDSVIVRPGHIFGPTASPRDKRVASEFAYLAAQGKDLEMKSLGLQKRSYCYCLDCALAILTVLLNGEKGESYNIGHTEVTSIREMAKILADAGAVNLKINDPTEADLKQFNPMNNSSLDIGKICSIGYKDVFSVKEGLEHTVQILKNILKV
jgi:nucleoside-diphosphate-sugar epimerase